MCKGCGTQKLAVSENADDAAQLAASISAARFAGPSATSLCFNTVPCWWNRATNSCF